MPKVALMNQDGSQAGDVSLNDAVFGIEPNTHVMHEAVVMQQASMRQGTHKVKNRSEVSGGGRKPWRQKEQAVPGKDQSVHHNGLAAELYLAQHHVVTAIKCQRKCAV